MKTKRTNHFLLLFFFFFQQERLNPLNRNRLNQRLKALTALQMQDQTLLAAIQCSYVSIYRILGAAELEQAQRSHTCPIQPTPIVAISCEILAGPGPLDSLDKVSYVLVQVQCLD